MSDHWWSISGHWVWFRGLLGGHRCTLGGVYPVHGDLVSCSVGVCMCRPGLYIRSSGLVSCSVGLHMLPLGVYIRSLGLVSWSVEDVFLWLLGVPMAIESLSGSWSAQVPERPTAVGSCLVDPGGCRGVDPCGPSRRIPRCRRIGRIDAPLRPFAWFYFGGGLAAGRPTVETSLTLRPFACSVAHLSVYACFRDHPQNLAFRCGRP